MFSHFIQVFICADNNNFWNFVLTALFSVPTQKILIFLEAIFKFILKIDLSFEFNVIIELRELI